MAALTLNILPHLGCTIPPMSTAAGWGMQGPGPRYIEAGGDRHLYTNRTVRYRVHTLTWMARLLTTHPIPTNLRTLDRQARAVSW